MYKVLFICTDWYRIDGSTASLSNLIDAVKAYVTPIVLINNEGPVAEYFRGKDIECIIHNFFYLWENPKKIKTIIHHPAKSTFCHYLFDNANCARYVAKQLKETKIDIVHSNSSITTVGCNIAKHLGAKHVWHIRESLDLDFGVVPYRGFTCLKRKISRADGVVYISNALKDHWNISSKRIASISDAVIPNALIPNEVNHNRQKYFLFCSASISENKGASTAVKAFGQSGISNFGYSLHLVGNCDDKYKAYLLYAAEAYGCSDAIIFDGYQPTPEKYFKKAAGFLMCSKFEGLGRVTVEAMANGCPVIARNSGGTTDFIIHGENGYLFNTDEECAHYIKQIVENPQDNIVENAIKTVNERFTEEVFGKKMIEFYNSLI